MFFSNHRFVCQWFLRALFSLYFFLICCEISRWSFQGLACHRWHF